MALFIRRPEDHRRFRELEERYERGLFNLTEDICWAILPHPGSAYVAINKPYLADVFSEELTDYLDHPNPFILQYYTRISEYDEREMIMTQQQRYKTTTQWNMMTIYCFYQFSSFGLWEVPIRHKLKLFCIKTIIPTSYEILIEGNRWRCLRVISMNFVGNNVMFKLSDIDDIFCGYVCL